MLEIRYQNRFKKDYKLALKRGCDPNIMREVISLLADEKELPEKYHDHKLEDTKEYKGYRECHIQPDWLLIYAVQEETLVLLLVRTGAHSDLF